LHCAGERVESDIADSESLCNADATFHHLVLNDEHPTIHNNT
jgi:hypothetical protein